MITDRSGQCKALLPINHKNYNFREKKNGQVKKERENFDLNDNFKCDNKLASELVEKRSFLNQSQSRKLQFL